MENACLTSMRYERKGCKEGESIPLSEKSLVQGDNRYAIWTRQGLPFVCISSAIELKN